MIKINNIQKSYSYPLILLKGSVLRSLKCDKIFVSSDSEVTDWPIIDSNFKFLVHLKKAFNEVEIGLRIDAKHNSKLKLTLKFEAISRTKFLKIVYLVCDDGNGGLFEKGSFQAPQTEDNSIESAINRIAFNMLCSQCLFAQTVPNRRTFNLELDMNNIPRVHVFKLSATADQIWSMDSSILWQFVAKQLMSSTLADKRCKYIAFSSFTRYSRNSLSNNSSTLSQRVKGYSALGGGRLALIGTACLYTWAADLKQLQNRFQDTRPIDSELMDDSNNRNCLWGCYSTTLGAVLHELGHVFDLGHSQKGIMALDFHHIRSFFISKPNHLKEIKWWTSSQISLLYHHKWLNHTNDNGDEENSFTVNRNTIKSKFGIICVEYRDSNKENTFKSRVFTLAVKCLQLEQFSDAIAFVMDSKGNTIKVNLDINWKY